MVIAIIIGIVALLFIVGMFQKKEEQKIFREDKQLNGGFRSSFPILVEMLEGDLGMTLVADTGDDFFYQKEINSNNVSVGKFRIGRRIDYSRNNLLYTEFISSQGERNLGMPICFDGEKSKEEYKSFMKSSYTEIFKIVNILPDTMFFNYFLPNPNENSEVNNNIPSVIRDFSCTIEDGQIKKKPLTAKFYKNDRLIKNEKFDSGSFNISMYEKEDFFYKDGRVSSSICDNAQFTDTHWYFYNENSLLQKIETDSLYKKDQSTIRYISKTITYDDKNLILEENNMGSNGEIYETHINEYDVIGNPIVQIIGQGSSSKKHVNTFDNKRRILEQFISNKVKFYDPNKTVYFEYDDEKYIIRKTLKWSSLDNVYSFLTILYHDSNWRIQKEEEYNNEDELQNTISYLYNDMGLAKIENHNGDEIYIWTEFVFE